MHVGVYQGSNWNPVLFSLVLEARYDFMMSFSVSDNFKVGLTIWNNGYPKGMKLIKICLRTTGPATIKSIRPWQKVYGPSLCSYLQLPKSSLPTGSWTINTSRPGPNSTGTGPPGTLYFIPWYAWCVGSGKAKQAALGVDMCTGVVLWTTGVMRLW